MEENMVEKIYKYSTEDKGTIERIINDENLHLNHMVINKGDGLPEHFSNSNVYMVVIKGILSLQLDEQDVHQYFKGDILNIPYNTKMNVRNNNDDVLEIFVIKAPNPKDYVK